MSPIVCQGLQSCLDPWLVEPRVLRHKLLPPKSNSYPQRPSSSPPEQENHQEINSDNEEEEEESNNNCRKNTKNGDLGGWSFIQSLTSMSQNCKEVVDNEKVYVHPLVKRSSSTLSKKSLEMCTESLGSETGSDSSDELPEFSLAQLSPKNETSHSTRRSKSLASSRNPTRGSGSESFPPPLSSISGLDGFQVRPHREGGRLVIKAVPVASCSSFFQAERVGGRLRLCLLKDSSLDCCHREEDSEGNEKLYSVEEDEDAEEHASVGETESASENYDDEDDDDNDEDGWVGIGGNSGNVGCEIEIGEFPSCRPSRCKEGGRGNKGMSSWGPFWVATS